MRAPASSSFRPLADIVSPEVRSRMMAGIGPGDTKPELAIRKGLCALGYGYRLGRRYKRNGRLLPGRPDIVFPGRKAVILVHGCFWHGHDCPLFKWPAKGEGSEKEVNWRRKLQGNIERDRRVRASLLAEGWRVLEVWECTLRGRTRMPFEDVMAQCRDFLEGSVKLRSIGGDQTVTTEVSE